MKYTVSQAADLVGVNPRRVRKDIAAGRLKARRVARDSRGTYEIDEAALRVTYADVFEAREAPVAVPPAEQAPPQAAPAAAAPAPVPAPTPDAPKEPQAPAAAAPVAAAPAPAPAPAVATSPAGAAEVEARLLREMLARECAHSEWLHEQLAHALRMLDARSAPAGRQVLVLGEDSREDAPAVQTPMPAPVQTKAPASPAPAPQATAPEPAEPAEPEEAPAAPPAPAGLDAMRAALRKPGASAPTPSPAPATASAPSPAAAPAEDDAPEAGEAPLADRFAAYQRRLDQTVANLRRSRMS